MDQTYQIACKRKEKVQFQKSTQRCSEIAVSPVESPTTDGLAQKHEMLESETSAPQTSAQRAGMGRSMRISRSLSPSPELPSSFFLPPQVSTLLLPPSVSENPSTDDLAQKHQLLESFISASQTSPKLDLNTISWELLSSARTSKLPSVTSEMAYTVEDRQHQELRYLLSDTIIVILQKDGFISSDLFDSTMLKGEDSKLKRVTAKTVIRKLFISHVKEGEKTIDSNAVALTSCNIGENQRTLARLNLKNGNEIMDSLLKRHSRDEDIEKAIFLYYNAMAAERENTSSPLWAEVNNNLATAMLMRTMGDPVQNLEVAINLYDNALKVWTKTMNHREKAKTLTNLGNAFLVRIAKDENQNIERAIKLYKDALELYTPAEDPLIWGITNMNLGVALCNRVLGNKTQDIEQAIAYIHKAILSIPNDGMSSIHLAKTWVNLGNANFDRIIGDRKQNIEMAIRSYETGIELLTSQDHKAKLDAAHIYMARARVSRTVGNWTENLDEGMKLFLQASSLWKPWFSQSERDESSKENAAMNLAELVEIGVLSGRGKQFDTTKLYQYAIDKFINADAIVKLVPVLEDVVAGIHSIGGTTRELETGGDPIWEVAEHRHEASQLLENMVSIVEDLSKRDIERLNTSDHNFLSRLKIKALDGLAHFLEERNKKDNFMRNLTVTARVYEHKLRNNLSYDQTSREDMSNLLNLVVDGIAGVRADPTGIVDNHNVFNELCKRVVPDYCNEHSSHHSSRSVIEFCTFMFIVAMESDVMLEEEDMELLAKLEGADQFSIGNHDVQLEQYGICVKLSDSFSNPKLGTNTVKFRFGAHQLLVYVEPSRLTPLGFSVLSFIFLPGRRDTAKFLDIMTRVCRFQNCFIDLCREQDELEKICEQSEKKSLPCSLNPGYSYVFVPYGWLYWFDFPADFVKKHGTPGNYGVFVRNGRSFLRSMIETNNLTQRERTTVLSNTNNMSFSIPKYDEYGSRKLNYSKGTEYLYLGDPDNCYQLIHITTPNSEWEYTAINANFSALGYGVGGGTTRARKTIPAELQKAMSTARITKFVSFNQFVTFPLPYSPENGLMGRIQWLEHALERKNVSPRGNNRRFLEAVMNNIRGSDEVDVFQNDDCRVRHQALQRKSLPFKIVCSDGSSSTSGGTIFLIDDVKNEDTSVGKIFKTTFNTLNEGLSVLENFTQINDCPSNLPPIAADLV